MKRSLTLLLSVLLAPGCLFVAGDDDAPPRSDADETTGDSAAPGDTAEPAELLEACRGEHDAQDAAQIAYDFEGSIHEMVACGGLAVTLCSSIVYGIVEAIIDGRSDATPDGWVYAGEGVYTSNAAGAGMTTRFFLAQDYSFGSAGDPLEENLFLASTYLRGASVELELDPSNPLQSRLYLHFDGPGPYVELLGLGAEPSSPIAVGSSTWSQIQDQLGTLEFESVITVDDPQNDTTVRYEVETPRMPASVLLGGGAMQYELIRADASRGDLDQDLRVEDWGVEFVSGSVGALQGTITFGVEGGPFGFRGALDYANSTYGEVDLECL